jgi:hypothetical protein
MAILIWCSMGCYAHRHEERDVVVHPEGAYHVDGHVDAFTLQLDPDGAWYSSSCGCDFFGASTGVWRRDGDTVVFRPTQGEKALSWPTNTFAGAELRGTLANGVLTVEGRGTLGSREIERWVPGRICVVCGGQLGPTGLQSCSERLPMAQCPSK